MKKSPAGNEKIKLITDKYNEVMHKNDTALNKFMGKYKKYKAINDQCLEEQAAVIQENENRLRELVRHFQELKTGEPLEYQKFIDAYIDITNLAIENTLAFIQGDSYDLEYFTEKERIKEKVELAKNNIRIKGELYVNSLSNPVKLNPDIIAALERIYLIQDKYSKIIYKCDEAMHKMLIDNKYKKLTKEKYNSTKISIFKRMKDDLQNLSEFLQKLKTGKIKEYDDLIDAYLVSIEVDIEQATIYKQFTDEDLDYWLEKKQIDKRKDQSVNNIFNLINIYMQSQGISNEDMNYFEMSR